ncbi:periplasmic heavy metal sensor [Telmatospirillum sp.]|uniref:periplasmic heavy metal sensor n=1 Tax=Telmatospirillum sp. TaxID=2079197 RepID=UPI00283F705F|nr:periplasmic heavy metal sensor [Telmatospirillum sp.]MDR3440223.1 periplasmic heavy metal sensor [Telmatospirillum sp.]
MAIVTFLRQWLLPASLALNVFLGAALVSYFFGEPPQAALPPQPQAALEDMTSQLSPEDARILRQALTPRLADMDRMRQAEMDLPRRLQQLLAKEPFDPAAFHEELEKTQRAREALNTTLPEALARLSPEGRRRLADWRPPREPHGGPNGGGPMFDGGPRPNGPPRPDGPPPTRP